MITSFYGRRNIENMINTAFSENKVKYVRDKKNSLLTGHNAYLSQANNNILQKSDIVNNLQYKQTESAAPFGAYDPIRRQITIFENSNLISGFTFLPSAKKKRKEFLDKKIFQNLSRILGRAVFIDDVGVPSERARRFPT